MQEIIDMPGFPIFFVIFIFIVMYLAFEVQEVVESILFNRKMKVLYRAQKYKINDLKSCLNCGEMRVPPCRLIAEGIFTPFIFKKYYKEKIHFICGCEQKVIVKWNGFDSAMGIE